MSKKEWICLNHVTGNMYIVSLLCTPSPQVQSLRVSGLILFGFFYYQPHESTLDRTNPFLPLKRWLSHLGSVQYLKTVTNPNDQTKPRSHCKSPIQAVCVRGVEEK
jgi:hypothetical protein